MIRKQKRTLFIAGGVLAAVLAAGLLVLWVTLWAPPSRQDFKDARATLKTIDDSYEKIDDAYQKYYREVRYGIRGGKPRSTVLAESAADKKAYLEAMDNHKAAIEDFEENKAYKDAEVATAYGKFITKDKQFVANSEGFVYPLLPFTSSLYTCEDVFQVASAGFPKAIAKQHKEASNDCLADLDEAAQSKPGPLATYGKKFAAIIRERQSVFDKAASGDMSLEDSSKKIREISGQYGVLDPLGEVQKDAKAVNFADELDALKKLLDRKAAE